MTTRPLPNVPKSLFDRAVELSVAAQVIRDSLEGINQGRWHQLVPLAGQLRGLLTDRRKDAGPLLLNIAETLGQDLTIYVPPALDLNSASPVDGFVFSGASFSLSKELPDLVQATLGDSLDRIILAQGNTRVSLRKAINTYAEKAGGTHYSKTTPQEILALTRVRMNGLNGIQHAVYQVGQVVYKLCRRLLQAICEFDTHMILVISDQRFSGTHCILDAKFKEGPARQLITIDGLHRIRYGLLWDGIETMVHGTDLIPINSPIHIIAGVRLSEDLATELTLQVNEGPIARVKATALFLVTNNWADYDLRFGRSDDDQLSSIKARLGAVAVMMPQDTVERAETILHFRDILDGDNTAWPDISKSLTGKS